VFYRIKQFPHNLIFFSLAPAYIWLIIEPRLIYNCFGNILSDAPIFVTGWQFLKNSLCLPGGFVMYVSGFLSQGFYYSWLGTVVIVLSALLICELSRRHLVAAGYTRSTVLTSFPAILLFLIYSRYKHPLPASLTVSLGLLSSLVFERLPLRRFILRTAVYCLIAAVVFWLTGAGGLLVFSLMTVIYAIFINKDLGLAALALPVGCAIIWGLASYLFLIPPQQAFLVLTPVSRVVIPGVETFSRVLLIILYGFVPSSALLLFLGKKLFAKTGQSRKIRSERQKRRKKYTVAGQKPAGHLLTNLSLTRLKKPAALIFPVGLMLLGLYLSYEPMTKPFVLAHHYSLCKKWDRLLELGRTLPKGKTNVHFNHDVIRALYHTGRLPYDLFEFPMTPHALFLTHEKKVSYLTQLKLCDTYLELGQVNMAEKLASEILATKNNSGIAIEKLTWINIIKSTGQLAMGQNRSARIYLNAMKKDLIYRSTADDLLHAMNNGFTPEQAAYIDRIRSSMLPEGHPGTATDSVEQMLKALLENNPRNKMAFEYLMTCYLLSGQVDNIAANVQRLVPLGYQTIPLLYEEAVLIHLGSRGQKFDSEKFRISPHTIQRYNKFVKLRSTMQPYNQQVVLKQLIVEFGSSYFFYYTFGCVGLNSS
jgi:hypothetical protein